MYDATFDELTIAKLQEPSTAYDNNKILNQDEIMEAIVLLENTYLKLMPLSNTLPTYDNVNALYYEFVTHAMATGKLANKMRNFVLNEKKKFRMEI